MRLGWLTLALYLLSAPAWAGHNETPVAPSSTIIGGIKSITSTASQWINSIGTDGTPTKTQPAFSDISGSAACTQLPALTGNVTTTAGSCSTTLATIPSGSTLTDAINQEYVVSTADLSKTNDAALATITGLSLALTGGKTYNCRGHIHGVSGATGGVKVALTASGGLTATSLSATAMTLNGAAFVTSGVATITALGTIIGVAAIYSDMYIDMGIVVNVGGTLLVQGAQQASNATTTTFLKNSTFQCIRVN